MPSSVLFAGSSGPLTDALTTKADAAGETVVFADPAVSETVRSSSHVRVPWSPRSPLSARSLTTSVLNACGSLDRATVVIAPTRAEASLVATGISEIERYLDEQVRSVVYVVRELLRYMEGVGQGSVTLVLVEPADGASSALQALAGGAADAFAATVLEHYRESGPPVYGFVGSDVPEEVEGFAEFIVNEQQERAARIRGRMQRFGKRGAFRSLFRAN
ncbi:MAG: hypothetical protein ACOCRN_04610 [Spirochaetia bacterium]